MRKITWKIGGEAGFGIMVSGLTFSKTLSRCGYHTVEINEYPSLIRGGHNVVVITFSDEKVFAPYQPVNILVALNRQTIDLHKSELSDDGIIIYDNGGGQIDTTNYPTGVKFIPLPLLSLAKSVGGDILMRNTVALGASLAVLDLNFDVLAEVLSQQFGRKGEAVVKQNIDAGRSGFDYVKQNYHDTQLNFPKTSPQEKKLVITGSEAIGLGAIGAGMQFFAAYPMTPINGLLHFMAAVEKKIGIIYKQPEDEIAGINMAIGASFAGVRSMTATSGGGFSLMVEGIGLAGMTETPVVVVMGMRPGPSTGLPTWTGQGDLHFILNASQGEFPRLVVAPGDAEEAFYLTAEAFNLADKYQTPTFVLVDKYLCESRFSTPIFDFQKVKIDRGKLLTVEEQNALKELKRYALTPDGISPRGIPGRTGGVFRANSDEHNESGFSEEGAENTRRMIEKRMQKQTEANKNVPKPTLFGEQDADVTLVGWGSTKGAVLEAMKEWKMENARLSAGQGKWKMNYLHLNYINPFPTDAVSEILEKAKKVIDVEGNHNGQMADLIKMKTGIEIKDRILKYDGRPFYPEDIIEGMKKYV